MHPKINKAVIPFLVLAGLALIGAVSGFIHFFNKYQKVAAERRLKENELQAVILKVNNLPELKEEVARLEAEESNTEVFVPDKEGQAEFIWELEKLAEESGARITSCKIDKESKQFAKFPKYRIYQWKVNLSSNYSELIKFLQAVPRVRRSVMVSQLKINSKIDEEATQNKYSLTSEMILDLITSAGEKVVK